METKLEERRMAVKQIFEKLMELYGVTEEDK